MTAAVTDAGRAPGALGGAVIDVTTMIGRSVRHSVRSVDTLATAVLLPVLLLLLFVYVFGGAIEPDGGYLGYVVPGIVLLCAAFGSASTAVAVSTDMTTGVIDRFRSLPILSSAVLPGHVVASVLRNCVSTAIVVGIAVAIGFRPSAGPLAWLGVLGMLVAFMAAVSWVAAAFGLLARTPEAAGAFSFVVIFLPYVSSAFVPTDTMPEFLRGFATHQPTTPVIETLRALLLGTPVGGSAAVGLAWCVGLSAAGILACALLFRRATAAR